jgi:dTDP-4-amino-4,6-dideoxygalactose transaminase
MSVIPFVDLAAQQRALGGRIRKAISKVLDHGSFIMGPEVFELEELLSARVQRRHCVTCASGTGALQMALMALEVKPGDRVVVPDFTFVATAEAVCLVGAEPVFADVDPVSYNLDLDSAESAWELPGPPPVGIIAVDLFGHPARSVELESLAHRKGAWFVVDGAQSFGATRGETSGISHGVMATTSFYPSKPLGAYGDGGAVFCDDDSLDSVLRSIRTHGAGDEVYVHERIGLTGRLDTIQAAVLLSKLGIFDQELEKRREVAECYSHALRDFVATPTLELGIESVWAQYTVQVDDRERVRAELLEGGVPTAVFYPQPLHEAPAYQSHSVVPGGVAVTERISGRVVSLPIHPYLGEVEQDWVISALRKALASK